MNQKKILIVDDEASIRKLMRTVLGGELYEFTEASNGLDAKIILQNESFDLLISDVIMPDCDGIELVVDTRQKQADIKIIIMSGGGGVFARHYRDLAETLGLTQVLEKPFSATALRQTVQELLNEGNV